MADVPIREVICPHCSRRTTQRLSTLEPILWLQATSSEDGIYINYACPACGKLARALVLPPAKTLQDADAAKSSDDLTAHVVFLKCAETGCESPIILLAPVKNTLHNGDLVAHIRDNWKTLGAACAKNHPPAHPYEFHIWKQLVSEP